MPCVTTAWAIPDAPPQTNRDWVGRPPPITVQKPFTQVDQSNPRGPVQPNRDWVGQTPFATGISYAPCVVTGWALPDGPPQTNRDWIGQPPPQSAAQKPFTQVDQSNPRWPIQPNRDWTSIISQSLFAKPPAAASWLLPVRPASFNTSWVQTPQQASAAVVTYLPSLVTASAITDGPFQPNRDWFSSASAAPYQPVYEFRDLFLATRLTLQYDRGIHSFIGVPGALRTSPAVAKPFTVTDWPLPRQTPATNRDWINQPGALLTPPAVAPVLVSQENPRQVAATNRDWSQANETLLQTTPAARPPTPYDWPVPKPIVAAFDLRTWTQANETLLQTAPPDRPPTSSFNWPLPGQVERPDRASNWINQPGALLTPPPVVEPPIVTEQPPSGGVWKRGGRPLYKTLKLKKKHKREQCEELLEYLRGLPPAQAQEICEALPPSQLSLLDGVTIPHGIVLVPRTPDDDEDEEEIALLLQQLGLL